MTEPALRPEYPVRTERLMLIKGEWSTELVFAMLAEEWFAGRA